MHFFQKLTKHSQNVLNKAIESAVFENSEVKPIHLLCAIFEEKGSIGSNILKINKASLPPPKNKTEIKNIDLSHFAKNANNFTKTKFSQETLNVFEKAVSQAMRFHQSHIGTEHLLFGIIEQKNLPLGSETIKKIRKQLEEILISAEKFLAYKENIQKGELIETMNNEKSHQKIKDDLLKKEVKTLFNKIEGKVKELEKKIKIEKLKNNVETKEESSESKKTAQRQIDKTRQESQKESPKILPPKLSSTILDFFCLNFIEEARRGKFDPLIGREFEISRLCRILLRRTKNNPILIGEAGVGKTAIVQGLAQKIVLGEVPEPLLNKTILSLDLSLLVAGTIFRGEFEARLKEIIEEAKNKKAILFIDEIHTIVGAGSAMGTLDTANMLKPPLSRGEIQCIGATTYDEYKKHIEKDKALSRRFQPIYVKEENMEAAIKTLEGIKDKLEKHYSVKISGEAIKSAVELSVKYLKDKFLPDKAIDVLEEAASKIKIGQKDENKRQFFIFEQKLKEIFEKKEGSILAENFDEAAKLKKEEETLVKKISDLEKIIMKNATDLKIQEIKKEDIVEIVSEITNVPSSKINDDGKNKLLNLESKIGEKIIGQKEAIKKIVKAILRSRLGLAKETRPLASFMFLGPTGVGKTEIAKVLAKEIFDEKSFIKLDMSEFMEPHSISRLIGSPPGYVGYEEGGYLTEKVKRQPYSLILFDEIEKAHSLIHNILLQILDDAVLRDNFSGPVSFQNTIIILTSNIGSSEFKNSDKKLGFKTPKKQKENETISEKKEKVLKILKNRMRPELLNRIGEIIVFNPLGNSELKKIAQIRMEELKEKFKKEFGLDLKFEEKILEIIAKKAKTEEGARGINRAIEELIESPLAEKIIEGKLKDKTELNLKAVNGKIEI